MYFAALNLNATFYNQSKKVKFIFNPFLLNVHCTLKCGNSNFHFDFSFVICVT